MYSQCCRCKLKTPTAMAHHEEKTFIFHTSIMSSLTVQLIAILRLIDK